MKLKTYSILFLLVVIFTTLFSTSCTIQTVPYDDFHYQSRQYYSVPSGTIYYDEWGNPVTHVYPGMRVYRSRTLAEDVLLTAAILSTYNMLSNTENLRYNETVKKREYKSYKKNPKRYKKRKGIVSRKKYKKRQDKLTRTKLNNPNKSQKSFNKTDRTNKSNLNKESGGFGRSNNKDKSSPIIKKKTNKKVKGNDKKSSNRKSSYKKTGRKRK